MTLGLPDNFADSPDQRRAVLRTLFKEKVWQSRSGTSILKELRSGGFKIANEAFFSIRRDILGLRRFEESITSLSPTSLVPKSWHVNTHGLKLTKNFQYRLRATGTDPETGEPVERVLTIISDRQRTRSQLEAEMGSIIATDPKFYGIENAQIELFRAYQRP